MSFAAQFTKQFILKKSSQSKTPQKCQKCLESGHWTYECKNERKYVKREPRSKLVDKKQTHIAEEPAIKTRTKVNISSESSISSESEDEKISKTKKLSNLISHQLNDKTSSASKKKINDTDSQNDSPKQILKHDRHGSINENNSSNRKSLSSKVTKRKQIPEENSESEDEKISKTKKLSNLISHELNDKTNSASKRKINDTDSQNDSPKQILKHDRHGSINENSSSNRKSLSSKVTKRKQIPEENSKSSSDSSSTDSSSSVLSNTSEDKHDKRKCRKRRVQKSHSSSSSD